MKLRDYYRSLSSENRVHFWTIATSCIVAVLTFWIGISIQYIVYNQNLDNSKKLSHYQIVDRMYPLYITQFDSCQSIMPLLRKGMQSENSSEAIAGVIDNNVNEFMQCGRTSARILGENKYFFNKEIGTEIDENNSYILLGSKIIELSRSGIKNKKQLQDSIENYMVSRDFILQCGDINANVSKLTQLIAQLIQTWEGKSTESLVCKTMVAPYLIKNLILMDKELNSETVSKNTLFIQCGISLIISIIIGFMLFYLLVRLTFSKSNVESHRSTNEIEKLATTVKNQRKEISRLESCLFSKDQRIADLKKELDRRPLASSEAD
ncbi:MAG: hypothetical protein KHX42_09525 [Prevotella sp.]|nr:hypothetical protein [Prevotella sp.]